MNRRIIYVPLMIVCLQVFGFLELICAYGGPLQPWLMGAATITHHDNSNGLAIGSGQIGGYCFEDVNRNKQRDSSEPGIHGLPVILERLIFYFWSIQIRYIATAADGSYAFKNLLPGSYRITLLIPEDVQATTEGIRLHRIGFYFNKNSDENFGIAVPERATGGPMVDIIAEPANIRKGETARLRWSSAGAVKLEIDQGIGEVTDAAQRSLTSPIVYHGLTAQARYRTIEGSIVVRPSATQVFTITAFGEDNTTASDSATIAVATDAVPIPISLTTTTSIGTGGNSGAPGGSGGAGMSEPAETSSITTTSVLLSGSQECQEDDSGHFDISYHDIGAGGLHRYRVQLHSAQHGAARMALSLLYDTGLLHYGGYDKGDGAARNAAVNCDLLQTGMLHCELEGDGRPLFAPGDNCTLLYINFMSGYEDCPVNTCPSELRLTIETEELQGWPVSHGCFCCPRLCQDGQERLCPVQEGICHGAHEQCANGIWAGCRYDDREHYESSEGLCNDGLDNDCDGHSDCADPDCQETAWCEADCFDGIDNDGDGLTDCADPTCDGRRGAQCHTGQPGICDNGTETCTDGQLLCTRDGGPEVELCDAIDNDCDGETDDGFAVGKACALGIGVCRRDGVLKCSNNKSGAYCDAVEGEGEPEVCYDELDNDCDGLVDCFDPDCHGDINCNQSPLVEILNPAAGAFFDSGEDIFFRGTASDPEDGVLAANALIWSSSRNGQIGTGMSFTRNDLEIGVHTITLSVLDSGGAQAVDSIAIVVGQSGSRVWDYKTGGYIESSVVVYADNILFGCHDGKVYCLERLTGSKRWDFQTGGTIRSSPVYADGRVFIGSSDGSLYCLDAQHGTKLWQYATGAMVNSSPAFAAGRIYAGSGDRKVYCLDAQTGTRLWDFTTAYWIHSSPAVSDNRVYIGSDDNYLYCLNAATGQLVWRSAAAQWIQSSPAVGNGHVYVGSDDNALYCFDAVDGRTNWKFTTGGDVQCAPALWGNYVYAGSYDNKVYCINAQTGALAWEFMTGGYIISSPAVSNGLVYIGSADGTLYCLDALTGDQVWDFVTGYWIYASPVVDRGHVFVGSGDKKVYCLQDMAGFSGSWPMFKCNPARTGTE